MSDYYKQKNATQEGRQKNRAWFYKRKYGITLEDYDAMLEKQGGCCAICKSETSKRNDYFMVDHDHETGAVRGLLCSPCNSAIGLLGDNISTLQNAINYLSTHTH